MKEGDGEKPRQNVVVVAVVAVGFPVIVNSRNPCRTRWMVEPENFSACHGHKIIVFCFVFGSQSPSSRESRSAGRDDDDLFAAQTVRVCYQLQTVETKE